MVTSSKLETNEIYITFNKGCGYITELIIVFKSNSTVSQLTVFNVNTGITELSYATAAKQFVLFDQRSENEID